MSKHVITLVRCDMCEKEESEELPITTKSYVWMGRQWEIDVCPVDGEAVDEIFEKLTLQSRRVTDTGNMSLATTKRRSPHENSEHFQQFKNPVTGMYDCPFVEQDGARCHRRGDKGFQKANGLAVHHKRGHGINL